MYLEQKHETTMTNVPHIDFHSRHVSKMNLQTHDSFRDFCSSFRMVQGHILVGLSYESYGSKSRSSSDYLNQFKWEGLVDPC